MSVATRCEICGALVISTHLALAPCSTSQPAATIEFGLGWDYCLNCVRERPAEVLQHLCQTVGLNAMPV